MITVVSFYTWIYLLKALKLSEMLPYFSNNVIIHINVGLQQSSTHTFLIISSQVKVCQECVLSFRHFLLRLLAQNKITLGILFRPGSSAELSTATCTF